jgi:hypothetical protein
MLAEGRHPEGGHMRKALIVAVVGGIMAAAASVGFSQGKPSIQGVWRTTSVVTTGANPTTNTLPGSLVIFTRNHYSVVEMNNARQFPSPPPPKVAGKLTDAEKLARYEDWLPVVAIAGTYEIKGTTLIRRPLVNKGSPAPGEKAYPENTRELKFEGNDKMLQINKSADGKSTTTRTFMRLE